MRSKTKQYGFVTICSICGFPLRKEQVAINETIYTQDYDEHCDIELRLIICNECNKKIKNNSELSMAKAIKRFEEAMKQENGS